MPYVVHRLRWLVWYLENESRPRIGPSSKYQTATSDDIRNAPVVVALTQVVDRLGGKHSGCKTEKITERIKKVKLKVDYLTGVGGQTGKTASSTRTVWKVADRWDRTRNLSLQKRCNNHLHHEAPHGPLSWSQFHRNFRSSLCDHCRQKIASESHNLWEKKGVRCEEPLCGPVEPMHDCVPEKPVWVSTADKAAFCQRVPRKRHQVTRVRPRNIDMRGTNTSVRVCSLGRSLSNALEGLQVTRVWLFGNGTHVSIDWIPLALVRRKQEAVVSVGEEETTKPRSYALQVWKRWSGACAIDCNWRHAFGHGVGIFLVVFAFLYSTVTSDLFLFLFALLSNFLSALWFNNSYPFLSGFHENEVGPTCLFVCLFVCFIFI